MLVILILKDQMNTLQNKGPEMLQYTLIFWFLSLKYKWFSPIGCKDIDIRKCLFFLKNSVPFILVNLRMRHALHLTELPNQPFQVKSKFFLTKSGLQNYLIFDVVFTAVK